MSKPLVSVVIPARNERFLNPTIWDLLNKAKGEIEVIVHLDGYWPEEVIQNDKVKYIHSGDVCGMRAGINKCVAIAQGDIITKLDGHHIVSEGFDIELVKAHKPKQVQIMRRKRLDAENWKEEVTSKPDVDYEYLSYPDDDGDWGGPGLNGRIWTERILAKKDVLIDDNMSFQGSNWTMAKDYFHELGLMDDERFGPFWSEAQEIGGHVWLSGGTIVTNKNAYAMHLHKGKKHGRMYSLKQSWLDMGRNASMTLFKGEKLFKNQDRPLSWLIEYFWPVPTWKEEGLEKLKERERDNGWKV